MKKAFFLFLTLVVIGFAGYLVFPKSGSLPASVNKPSNNLDVRDGMIEEESSGVMEASEGLTLTITSPIDQSTLNEQTLQVIGKTGPNAEIYINDQEGKADSTGNFLVNISLDEGENVLSVVVNDQEGNYAEKELTVYLESTE